VILPGLTLENEPPNRFAAWTYRLGFGRFARDHTVYVINRRRGMPAGYKTQDMAADYARIIEGELGPSHVMGFSTGGEIAQYVAIDHPEVVLSLALIVSASRLSEEGRQACERWHNLTREARWQELRADMASATVTGERNKRLARAFMKVFGRIVLGAPSDPSDFLTTLEADLGHDTTGRLAEISAPTLILGGSEDPFYSEGLLRETAEGISQCHPARVRGRRARGPQRAQAPIRERRARVFGRTSRRFIRRGVRDGVTTNKGDGMKRLAVLLVVAAVLLGSCGAQGQGQGVGEMRNESRSIQPEDARSVCAPSTSPSASSSAA
jgi:pimeloyl-ACP methyl ester carboxylesterase